MNKTFFRGYIESHLYSQAIMFLHERVISKDTWKTQFLGFMKLNKMTQLWLLFENIINIHAFEDRNERIYRLILAHVLIQMKCCIFPAILNSFHRRGRRHFIRAVRAFYRKPSMLCTMIVRSSIHCWDNFEQNTEMLSRC